MDTVRKGRRNCGHGKEGTGKLDTVRIDYSYRVHTFTARAGLGIGTVTIELA